MLDVILARESKSLEDKAFEYWLRTGTMLHFKAKVAPDERKFNPYHDPDDGRFTFAPGGGTLPERRARASQQASASIGANRTTKPIKPTARTNSNADQPRLINAQFARNPRVRIGGNGGPVLNDPMTIEHAFPRLDVTPAGRAIIGLADNILDVTRPGARLTTDLANQHTNTLIRQIRDVDPSYRHESLGFPQTFEGQMNQIRHLRVERAAALSRVRNELRPMQVETLRHLQEQTEAAYVRGVRLHSEGRLRVRLSREEAIGNYVDQQVRSRLREFYNRYGISTSKEGPVRIIGRECASTGTDRTYRIPDSRVSDIAFDVSLTRKTLGTAQVRGFFASDFRPRAVIIVRPRQLGADSTYAITRPGR